MPKAVSGNTTVNSQRKRVRSSWSSYSKTTRTKACVDWTWGTNRWTQIM